MNFRGKGYIKGYGYKGWAVRYGWDAVKQWRTYTAGNPDRPGQVETFTRPIDAERWIDKQSGGVR